jgi:hypothetical protein
VSTRWIGKEIGTSTRNYANCVSDRPLSSRREPFPSPMKQPTLGFPSMSTRHRPSMLRHSPRSSGNRSIPPSTCLGYVRFSPSGTWTYSTLDENRGKTPIHTSGSNIPACRNGSKTCLKAHYPPSGHSLSLSYSIATSIFCHQARAYRIFTSMLSD